MACMIQVTFFNDETNEVTKQLVVHSSVRDRYDAYDLTRVFEELSTQAARVLDPTYLADEE